MGFRHPKRSEIQPAPIFTKLAVASATPSIRPRAAGGRPIAARNPGKTAVAISCPASERRLVNPMPTTFRFSQ